MIAFPTPDQAARAVRLDQAEHVLVAITVWQDRAAGTVASRLFFAEGQSVVFPWAGQDRLFLGDIESTSGLGGSIPPVPATEQELGRQSVELTLADRIENPNDPDSLTLWAKLRKERLEGATLELLTFLTDHSDEGHDLTAFGGSAVVRFRGVMTDPRLRGGRILLRAEHEPPNLPFAILRDPQRNDPQDFGRRLPVPIGQPDRVYCPKVEVGWVTALSVSLPAATVGDAEITDAEGLPDSSGWPFDVRVGTEELTIASVNASANTMNISARGINGTKPLEHAAGAAVIELLDEVVIAAAGIPIQGVRDLYLRDPGSGGLVRIAPSNYSTVPGDAENVPGALVTTIRITREALRSILDDIYRDPDVTVQPDFDGTTGGSSEQTAIRQYAPSDLSRVTDSQVDLGDWDNVGVSGFPEWVIFAQPQARERLRHTFLSGDLAGDGALAVKRWRARERIVKLRNDGCASCTARPGGFVNAPGDASATVCGNQGTDSGIRTGSWTSFPAGSEPTLSTVVGGYIDAIPDASGTFQLNDAPGFELRVLELEAEVITSGGVPGGGDVTLVRVTDTEITAASTGFGLEFYADLDGAVVPFVFTEAYPFDEGTGWTEEDLTQTDEPGVGQRFALQTTTIDVWNGDTDLDTMVVNGNGAISHQNPGDSPAGVVGGSARHVGVTQDDGIFLPSLTAASFGGTLDGTAGTITFRLALSPNFVRLSRFGLYVFDSLGSFSAFKVQDIRPDIAKDGTWYLVTLDLLNAPTPYRTSGTLDRSIVDAFILRGNDAFLGGGNGDCTFWLDYIEGGTSNGRAQRNATAGVVDLTSAADAYRVRITATGLGNIREVRVHVSNDAGAGTTLPANYRTLAIPAESLVEGSAVEAVAVVMDTGAPSFDNVETIQVEVLGQGVGTPEVVLEALLVSNVSNPDYGDPAGSLIELSADALRYFLADWCGLGHGAVHPSIGVDLEAGLSGLTEWAGDIAALPGTTFDEVYGRLCFEAGGSPATFELLTQTAYGIVAPNPVGQWPAPVIDIPTDELGAFEERLAPRAELATRYTALYARDFSIAADDERAYRAVQEGGPQQPITFVPLGDFVQAEAELGRLDAQPLAYRMIRESVSVALLFGLVVRRTFDRLGRGLVTCEVPRAIAGRLEVGDVVTMAPPYERTTPRTFLVLGVTSTPRTADGRLVLQEIP